MELLIVGLIECSDVQRLLNHIQKDRYLTSETKTELVQVITEGTPHCELNEGSEITG
tara:strand:- start:1425 stop:1595 length:171 start_codon:yes stop_codon:yes gene_type:complete